VRVLGIAMEGFDVEPEGDLGKPQAERSSKKKALSGTWCGCSRKGGFRDQPGSGLGCGTARGLGGGPSVEDRGAGSYRKTRQKPAACLSLNVVGA
jgi:hypothetical protein